MKTDLSPGRRYWLVPNLIGEPKMYEFVDYDGGFPKFKTKTGYLFRCAEMQVFEKRTDAEQFQSNMLDLSPAE